MAHPLTRRRQCGGGVGTFLGVALLGLALHIEPAASSRATPCDLIVAPGDDIRAAVDAQPVQARICLSSGAYSIDATVTPKTSQEIVGLGPGRPLIDCRTARFCFDGSIGSHVLLRELILDGARNGDVRTGDSWVLDGVEARNARVTGIQIRGSNVVVTRSYAHDNGALGISASFATDIALVSNEVAGNPTNPGSERGRSGGIKLNGVIGLVVRANRVHDNGGGAGIWLDTESQSFQVVGNRSFDNTGDQIRIEISCYGTVRDNIVSSGRSAGIDVFNAHDVTIASNRVNMRSGGRFGIRMFGSGRTATPGPGACLINGAFRNANNRAVSNVVTATRQTSNGIVHIGGIAVSNSWSRNEYHVPDCSAPKWAWWSGGNMLFLDFAGWRAVGQDRAGSCR